jgi:hypothetical protein
LKAETFEILESSSVSRGVGMFSFHDYRRATAAGRRGFLRQATDQFQSVCNAAADPGCPDEIIEAAIATVVAMRPRRR